MAQKQEYQQHNVRKAIFGQRMLAHVSGVLVVVLALLFAMLQN